MAFSTITSEADAVLIATLTRMVGQAPGDLRSLYEIADWYQRSLDRNIRKDDGIFYTPPELAQHLASSAIDACKLTNVAIVDPACGGGSLLLAAALALAEKLNESIQSIVNSRLFGIDQDPVAVLLCRLCLKKMAGIPLDSCCPIDSHIVVDDALEPENGWDNLLHSWSSQDGFPIVMANPPWGSFSGRRRISRDSVAEKYSGWQSIHGLFMELCLKLAKDGGSIAVIAPTQVAELEGYHDLRRLISDNSESVSVELVGETAFCGVNQSVSLYFFQKRYSASRRSSSSSSSSSSSWSVFCPESDADLVTELDSLPRMPREWFSDCGVHTGNAAKSLILTLDAGDQYPLIRHGACVGSGQLASPCYRLRTDLRKTEGLYFRFLPLHRYTSTSILLRQTAHYPIASLHEQPTYFRNSILGCTPDPGINPELIVSWLNSDFIRSYHRQRFHDARQKAFPQVKISHLASLPLPPCWYNLP